MRVRVAAGVATGLTLLLLTTAVSSHQASSVESLLDAAGRYLVEYQKAISSIVANETYSQRRDPHLQTGQIRRLRADVLAINDDAIGWARTINTPFMALRFITATNQYRSSFRVDGTRSIEGKRVPVVKFKERETPRLIRSIDEAAASGAFAVEPETGRILWTELSFQTTDRRPTPEVTVTLVVRVTYGDQGPLGWLPVRMEEDYDIRAGSTLGDLTGEAVYSDYRKFSVSSGG